MYRIGVDIGGTNIAVGLVNEKYKIVSKYVVKTDLPRTAKEICESISETIEKVLQNTNVSLVDVESIGIGSPGLVDSKNGLVISAGNLGFFNEPVVEMIKNHFNIKCFIENDGNAAAYGEYIAGAGKNTKNFIMLTLGTGVGGGIIIDGSIYAGSNNAGGELGHMVIDCNGIPCVCGKNGCLEKYASATALISQTKEKMLSNSESIMWSLCDNNIQNVTGRTAFEAAKCGDATANEIVGKYIWYLSVGIANIITVFQPDVLCIGGGISNEKDYLLDPLKEYTFNNYLKAINNRTLVKIASLGNDAGIIGAAFLGC